MALPWSPSELGFTISIDAIGCILLVVLFVIVRNLRGDTPVTPETPDIFGRLRRTSSEFMTASRSLQYRNVLGFIIRCPSYVANRVIEHRADDTNIYGLGGENYLTFLWVMGLFFSALSAVSLLVVYPLELGLVDVESQDPFLVLRNKIQNGTVLSGISFSGASAKRIREGSAGMWIISGCSWVYTFAGIYIISYLMQRMSKPTRHEKNQSLATVSQMFTIKVDNLPAKVDHRFNSKELRDLYYVRYGEIIAVHIVPQMDDLGKLYDDLELVNDMLQYLKELERQHAEIIASPQNVQIRWANKFRLPFALQYHIAPGKWWFPPGKEPLKFLIKAYSDRKDEIQRLVEVQENKDVTCSGCAFITFCTVASALSAAKVGMKHPFLSSGIPYPPQWKQKLCGDPVRRTCMCWPDKIYCELAPVATDINWENIAVSGEERILRGVLGIIILAIIMFFLVTPVSIAQDLLPLFLAIQADLKTLVEKQTEQLPPSAFSDFLHHLNESYNHLFTSFFTQYFPMVALIFLNSIILPVFIDMVARFMCHWQYEFKEQSTLILNYLFMVFNLLIIPLLGLDSINGFILYTFRKTQTEDVFTLFTEVADILGIVLLSSSATFAMKYFISSIFISSASQLLQAPQSFLLWWSSFWAITRNEKEIASKRWAFDWGYWYGYNCAFFAVAITFAPSVPTICPLAAVHFFIKYYVDRYTLVYGVFEPMFQAEGYVEQYVLRLLYSSLAFMQIVMSGFFAIQSVNDEKFIYISYAHLLFLFILLYLAIIGTDVKRDLSQLKELSYQELFNQYRTPSVDIEELTFREKLPTVYRHPAIRGNPRLKHWAQWQWPWVPTAYPLDRMQSITEEDQKMGLKTSERAGKIRKFLEHDLSSMVDETATLFARRGTTISDLGETPTINPAKNYSSYMQTILSPSKRGPPPAGAGSLRGGGGMFSKADSLNIPLTHVQTETIAEGDESDPLLRDEGDIELERRGDSSDNRASSVPPK